MITRLGQLALILTVVGWSAPIASAQSTWSTMHAYRSGADLKEQVSFKPTPEAAAEQLRMFGYSDAQATELEEQLRLFLDNDPSTASTCFSGTSSPGTRYILLGMNRAGELPIAAHNETQNLGVTLPVIECRISDISTPVHWFYDENGYQSFENIEGPCNNLAVIWPKQKQATPLRRTTVTPEETETTVTDGGMLRRKRIIVNSPGLWVPDCNCGRGTWLPGTTVIID